MTNQTDVTTRPPGVQERVEPTPPGEWREVMLGEIAEVVGGSTPSTSDPDNFDGNVPWLTPRDLAGPHDRYISHGARNLSQKDLTVARRNCFHMEQCCLQHVLRLAT